MSAEIVGLYQCLTGAVSSAILLQSLKQLSPEDIALKILQVDESVCTEVFLSEFEPVLPSPEQVGKLNVYRNSTMEELSELHPSDRLMVQLIKIDRLAPRWSGMLYKTRFEDTVVLQEEVRRAMHIHFRCLIQV
jgi:cytokinesis protein